jgi:hypothetical protein
MIHVGGHFTWTWRLYTSATSRALTRARGLIPLTLALLPSAGVALEVSPACLYNIMTRVQQVMTLCGEPLDHSAEVKYQELRAALKKYINENALRDDHKIGPDYDERLAREREQSVREGFCNRPEYKEFKANLLRLLHSEQEVDAIRKRLDTPGDPWKGGCL